MKSMQRRPESESVGRTGPERSEGLRCECGNLMALIKKEGIELKCRRCKRKVLIPLEGIADEVNQKWSDRLRTR